MKGNASFYIHDEESDDGSRELWRVEGRRGFFKKLNHNNTTEGEWIYDQFIPEMVIDFDFSHQITKITKYEAVLLL